MNESVGLAVFEDGEPVGMMEWVRFYVCCIAFLSLGYASFRFFVSEYYILFAFFSIPTLFSPQILLWTFEAFRNTKPPVTAPLGSKLFEVVDQNAIAMQRRDDAERKLSLMVTKEETAIGKLYRVGSEFVIVSRREAVDGLHFHWFKNSILLPMREKELSAAAPC